MHGSKFRKDLKLGEEYELKVMTVLEEYFCSPIRKNPDKMGVDLVGENFSIEVKLNASTNKTGNYFIEYQCNGKPSGILKYNPLPEYFAMGTQEEVHLFDTSALLQLCKKYGKSVTGGDKGYVRGFVMPRELIENNSITKFRIPKNYY